MVSATENRRTGASSVISWARGTPARPERPMTLTAANAMPTPITAAPTASQSPSPSNWRTRRNRSAPSALRTASSRARDSALTSRRLATLAQAMSRRHPTAPNTSHSGCRTVANASSVVLTMNAEKSKPAGYRPSFLSAVVMLSRSAFAWAIVTPGLRRAAA